MVDLERKKMELLEIGKTDITNLDINSRIKLVNMIREENPKLFLSYRKVKIDNKERLYLVVRIW